MSSPHKEKQHQELTFRDIETRHEKFAISNAALSSSGVTDHTGNEVTNVINVLDELFGRHMLRERGKSLLVRLEDRGALIVQTIKQFSKYNLDTIVVKVCLVLACRNVRVATGALVHVMTKSRYSSRFLQSLSSYRNLIVEHSQG